MGAPVGNNNATKNKCWREALQRIVAKRPKDLEQVAEALFAAAKQGDIAAIKELGDRLDGKASQDVNAKVEGNLTVEIVRFANQATG